MTVETAVLIAVIFGLIVNTFRIQGWVMVLDCRLLLLTEAFAESQGKEGAPLAKQIRDEINKKHFLLDKLMSQ